jgi:hypothetical protein
VRYPERVPDNERDNERDELAELDEDDRALLERRRAHFEAFVADAQPATEDFVRTAIVEDPEPYLANLELFIPAFAEMIRAEDLDDDALRWLHVRTMYMLGQYLCQRFDAQWVLDEVPGSPLFGNYCIDIPVSATGSYRVDPSELTFDMLSAPVPRDVYGVLNPVLEHAMTLRKRAGEGAN